MQTEYLRQAEEDLLFTVRKIAQERKLKTSKVVELESKAQVYLNKMRDQQLDWDAASYLSIRELYNTDLLGNIVKIRASIKYMAEPYVFSAEDEKGNTEQKKLITFLIFQDIYDDEMKSCETTNTGLIRELISLRDVYANFDILATLVTIDLDKFRFSPFRLLIHSIRPSENVLQIVRANDDEIAMVERKLADLRKMNISIFRFIKEGLVKNIGIKGLEDAELLNDSIDAMIVQSLSDGLLSSRDSAKINTLIIGAPAVGKKLLVEIAKALNPSYQEAHPSKATVAGVCSTAKKVDGGWVSQAGYIPLAHRGIFVIQDFHTVKNRDKEKLIGIFSMVMEDGKTIDSSAARTEHKALTSIHLDMNKMSDLFPKSIPSGEDIIITRLDDIKIPMNILSRFDYIVDIPRDTERQIKIALDMYDSISVSSISKHSQQGEWQRELQLIIAYLRTKHTDIQFHKRISDYMRQRHEEIITENKAHIDRIPYFGDFQTRLTNSIHKYVVAFARLGNRDKPNKTDVDNAFRLLRRKFEFIRTLDKHLKVPSSWTIPVEEGLENWLIGNYQGQIVTPKQVIIDYEKEFGIPLVRRTLERHLPKISTKIGHGKYSFQ